jgi:hypothetical protein
VKSLFTLPRILKFFALFSVFAMSGVARAELRISPLSALLDGPEETLQLRVGQHKSDGSGTDLTRRVHYEVIDPRVAQVDDAGLVHPLHEGITELLVRHAGDEARMTLRVQGLARPTRVSFERQIIPLLTRAGCNSGGCHGKAEGQNGFKLSVFGFDTEADHESLALESRGRRVSLASPLQSLLIEKATAKIPHGGGKRLVEGTLPYRRLLRWIEEGAGFASDENVRVTAIEVEPSQSVLAFGGTQQLRVTAIDSTGRRNCVSADAEFESNASVIASVDRRGGVQGGEIPGEAAILARYLGHVAVCRITIPRTGLQFIRPPEAGFVDRQLWNKLVHLGIPPSDLADDATILRRLFLDVIGVLPTVKETRAFLASSEPRKRQRLIDELLDRPEYADYWALRWSDLLRVDRDAVTAQGAVAMTNWLRRQFAGNRPYDQFVREILTARGNTTSDRPAAFYKVLTTPEVMSRSISQVFLGVRIECAQCHHHPSEKWGQDDYFALAGFFTGVKRKNLPAGAEAILVGPGADLNHPRTGRPVPTHALGMPATDLTATTDRRAVLADWMTNRGNPYFARSIANRLWSHYFGRGLVEPVDDLRATNPATNEPLLTELAGHLEELRFDLKAFTRTLLNSRAYQLAAATTANASDEQNFSHAICKAMPAEVLLDAVCQATGVPEKFNGWPEGARAVQVWDNRMPSYFLKLFGRPVRASVCECERSNEPSIPQALHLMNSAEIISKVRSRRGTVYQVATASRPAKEIIDDLYLGSLARFPTPQEQQVMLELFHEAAGDDLAAAEDVLWALLNTKEFVFNH